MEDHLTFNDKYKALSGINDNLKDDVSSDDEIDEQDFESVGSWV